MAELRIATVSAPVAELDTPLLVLHLFERDRQAVGFVAKIDQLYGGALTRILESGDFVGKKNDTLVVYPPDPTSRIRRVLLVGVGKREDHTVERLRRAVGSAVRVAERMNIRDIAVSVGHVHHLSESMGDYNAALAAVEAAALSAWDFRELKTQSDDDTPPAGLDSLTLVAHEESERSEFERAARHGSITARAVNLARDLQTRPGNVATPTYLAERAGEVARAQGLDIKVLDREQLRAEGMHALLAVAQGSAEEPRLIVLEHHGGGTDAPPLVLIGKGVTFDSGGISIKPSDRMEDMKYDMSGAAAVIGAMQAIAELQLRINVVGVIPATENLPSGTALKPGDVISSHLGKTIEIVNTDAEGRLIVADALSYARRHYKPVAMVNAATLTGAIVIALGHHAIGVMGNNGTLIDEVRAAGARTGERCWPLPLWDEYREQIDSTIADIRNAGGRAAGSITAGWFLKEFAGDVPWVHLDIAGTAYRDEAAPYLRKGGTGVPTRLFIEWVRARADA